MLGRGAILLGVGLLLALGAGGASRAKASPLRSNFGLAALEAARADLNYPSLGTYADPDVPSCALAVSAWVRHGADAMHVAPPVNSASALALRDQFRDPQKQALVGWLDAATLRARPDLVAPGMIAVWARQEGGHTGIVETPAAYGAFGTIEANHTSKVARFRPTLTSDNFLGMGFFRDPDAPPSPTPGAGDKLSLPELRQLAASVGFPPSSVNTAAAIAMAESGGRVGILGDGGQSFGLWQVHAPSHPEYDRPKLLTAEYNAKAALAISRGGTLWTPWSVFKSGAYKRFL